MGGKKKKVLNFLLTIKTYNGTLESKISRRNYPIKKITAHYYIKSTISYRLHLFLDQKTSAVKMVKPRHFNPTVRPRNTQKNLAKIPQSFRPSLKKIQPWKKKFSKNTTKLKLRVELRTGGTAIRCSTTELFQPWEKLKRYSNQKNVFYIEKCS